MLLAVPLHTECCAYLAYPNPGYSCREATNALRATVLRPGTHLDHPMCLLGPGVESVQGLTDGMVWAWSRRKGNKQSDILLFLCLTGVRHWC